MAKIEEIGKYVEDFFRERDKEYCGTVWFYKHHIEIVYNIGLELAEKYGADKEVVGLAALLHDVGKAIDPEKHDEAGALEAKRILKEYGYPEKTIEKVSHCIESHMCEAKQPETLEAKILSTADVLCKFKTPFFFILFASGKRLSPEEVIDKIKIKIEKDYKRVFFGDEKEEVRKQYEALKTMVKGV